MTDHETLETTAENTVTQSDSETEIESGLITFRKICDALGQPDHKINYQIRVLGIKCECKVANGRIFSQASFLRIKSGILGTANRQAAAAT